MALSGSFKTNGYTGSKDTIYLEFSWTATQSIVSNATTISWALKGSRTSSGYVMAGGFRLVIDGETVLDKSTDYRIELRNGTVVASGSKTITHKADGTRSFDVSMQGAIYTWAVNCWGNKTFTLDTIPRKSSLTVANGTLDISQTLTVTQQSSSFTHSIKAVCGSSVSYIKADGTTSATEVKHKGTSIPWKPPIGWAAQAPNNNSVSVTYTITTYSGSTNVGSTPVSVSYGIPYIDSLNPSIVPTITDATGYDKLLGGWVQGQSRVKVDVEAYGVYGSTIKSVQVVFEGNTYTGTSITTNAIAGYDVLPIKIIVTDTRERSRIVEPEIFVQKYSLPKITKFTAKRCDSDGGINPSGDHILVSFGAEITSLNNNNTAKYYVGYKKISEANHKAVELTNLAGQYLVDSFYIVPADTASSYTIIFNAQDAIKADGTRLSVDVPSAKQVWSMMKKNGDIVGIAVNKVAEHEGYFDIGMPVMFSGGVLGDFVIEQGELNGWTYRKWNSGAGECWKTLVYNTAVNTQWGGIYMSSAIARQNYPFPFIGKPVENVTAQGNSPVWIMVSSNGNGVNGAYASAVYHLCCPGSYASAEYYISYYCTGRWK